MIDSILSNLEYLEHWRVRSGMLATACEPRCWPTLAGKLADRLMDIFGDVG